MKVSSQLYIYFLLLFFLLDKLKSQNQKQNKDANKYDVNSEEMSTHDKEEIEMEFADYDLNRDGFIDSEEIQAVLKNMNKFDFVNFFTKVDIDSSGTISLDEYTIFIESN